MNAKILSAALVVVALSSVAGTSSAGTIRNERTAPHQVVVIRAAPPAEVVERRGPAPSNRHFWIGGHWRWDGRAYAWDRGRWEVRREHEEWVPGHWVRGREGGWFWTEGRWHRV